MAGSARSKARQPDASLRRDPPTIEGEVVAPPLETAAEASSSTAIEGVAGAESSTPGPAASEPADLEPEAIPDAVTEANTPNVPQPEPSLSTAASEPASSAEAMASAAPSFIPPPPASSTAKPFQPAGAPSWLTPFAAIVALLLAGIVIYVIYDLSGENRVADLESQVQMLQQRLVTLEKKTAEPSSEMTGLGKRIDDVAAKQATLETGLADLKRATAATQPPATAAAAPPPDLQPAIKTLTGRVDDLDQAVTALKPAVADVGPVQSRVADLGTQVSKLDDRLQSVSGDTAALKSTVDAIPRVDIAPVSGRIDALDARVKPLEAEVKAAQSPQRVAQRKAAPLAVTAQTVLSAVVAGRPFPDDLKALTNIGAEPATLEPLRAVAANGAPSTADLRSDLANLREKMISDGTPTPAGSYIDRLWAGANSVVQVRPTGSVVGDTPAAVVARLDADLGADDLKAALDEWGKLPDASRTVSKGLADRIRLRLAAEDAARSLAASAISVMGAAAE